MIACANLGGLQLNQGIHRLRELSIRSALGASRRRLVALLMFEGLTLAFLATLLSLFLTQLGLVLILNFLPEELLRQSEIQLNPTIFLFAGGLALACTLLFSLGPAMVLTRMDLFRSIRGTHGSTESAPHRGLRGFFVTAQVAISLVLLMGGGLLFRSYIELEFTDPGFRSSNLVALQVFPDMDDVRRPIFHEEVMGSVGQLAGVEGVAGVLSLPLSGEQSIELTPTFQIEGREQSPPGGGPIVNLSVATPNYFQVMGIPLLEGRPFGHRDDARSSLVGLINETMAGRFWPDGDSLGARIHLEYGEGLDLEVVGVVASVRHTEVGTDDGPRVYLPYSQGPDWSITFVARTTGPSETLIPVFKTAVWEAGYRRPIDRVTTLDWLFAESICEERFRAWVTGVFALMALLVISVGLYSMISFGVVQRRREIGIRKVLGATRKEIFRDVLLGDIRRLVLGTALGLVGALLLSRMLSGFLYQVVPGDMSVILGCLILLVAVALPATMLPARRASRVSPLQAIRAE